MILHEIILSKLVDLSYICALYYSSTTLRIVNISSLYGIIYKLRSHCPFIDFYYFLIQLMVKGSLIYIYKRGIQYYWFNPEASVHKVQSFLTCTTFHMFTFFIFPNTILQLNELQLTIF